ncbi:hypothetical protein D3C81_1375670 [compost metagenome]
MHDSVRGTEAHCASKPPMTGNRLYHLAFKGKHPFRVGEQFSTLGCEKASAFVSLQKPTFQITLKLCDTC